jgi:hypothetical protein
MCLVGCRLESTIQAACVLRAVGPSAHLSVVLLANSTLGKADCLCLFHCLLCCPLLDYQSYHFWNQCYDAIISFCFCAMPVSIYFIWDGFFLCLQLQKVNLRICIPSVNRSISLYALESAFSHTISETSVIKSFSFFFWNVCLFIWDVFFFFFWNQCHQIRLWIIAVPGLIHSATR